MNWFLSLFRRPKQEVVHGAEQIDGMVRIIEQAIDDCKCKTDFDRLLVVMRVNLEEAYAGNRYAARKAQQLRTKIGAKQALHMAASIRKHQLLLLNRSQRK